MNRDDLLRHLMVLVTQGVRVPEHAFEIAQTIPLERFQNSSPRVAALTVLRMGLRRRFGFFSVRPSLLEKGGAEDTGATAARRHRRLSPCRPGAA